MGKRLSKALNPFKDFNIENRAHRVISKDKPTPAPRYPADINSYEKVLKEHPEIIEESSRKHEQLNKHLKDVFVKSHDAMPAEIDNPNRPLPLNRRYIEDSEFGYNEPAKVRIGKATLRTVLKFLTKHHEHPRLNNATKIAEDYSLPEEKVENILKYCRIFEVYIPTQEKVPKNVTFFGPGILRFRKKEREMLDDGKKTDK